MKMKRYFYLFLVFIVTFSISMIPDISFAISADDPELVAQETKQIEKFKENVKREGDKLFLKLNSGSYISMKDNLECKSSSNCIFSKFYDYFKDIGFYYVHSVGWEGTTDIMISESDGRKHYVFDLPIFSPDRRRLVTIPTDTDAGYNRNGVFIWRIEGNELIPEFSYEPTGYVWFEFVEWKDESHIVLKKGLYSSKELCPESSLMTVLVSLKVEADGWKLYENFSPETVDCDVN